MAKMYIVHVRKQFPAWDEKEGFVYEISAKSKREAIKRARAQAFDDGHVGPGSGRSFFTARPADEVNEQLSTIGLGRYSL